MSGIIYEHNENHKMLYIRLKKENDPVRETGSKGREHDKKIKYDPAREDRVNREESINIYSKKPQILNNTTVFSIYVNHFVSKI